jgi:nicotinic acetylcholine receptor
MNVGAIFTHFSADAIYDDQADKKFRAGVNSDGYIQWVPGGKFITSCQLDITMYPFDHQECEMDFVDWTYDGRFVMLLNGSHEIGMDVFKKHGEWEIVRTKSFETNQYFDSDPGIPFPTVKFVFYLKRKPKFYMINVVAPCILMSVLASLVFYLPPESGEKVSLGITVLLSFSVFLLLIAENVPKTSDCVPLIGGTMFCSIIYL